MLDRNSEKSEVNPAAVVLARGLLIFAGVTCFVLGVGVLYAQWPAPTWPTYALFGLSALFLGSGFFESSTGAVASVIILFYPWP